MLMVCSYWHLLFKFKVVSGTENFQFREGQWKKWFAPPYLDTPWVVLFRDKHMLWGEEDTQSGKHGDCSEPELGDICQSVRPTKPGQEPKSLLLRKNLGPYQKDQRGKTFVPKQSKEAASFLGLLSEKAAQWVCTAKLHWEHPPCPWGTLVPGYLVRVRPLKNHSQ